MSPLEMPQIMKGVCKTRKTPGTHPEHPGTPRDTPGTPPEHPRNTTGTPSEHPGTPPEHPRNTPGTSHIAPDYPQYSQEHP